MSFFNYFTDSERGAASSATTATARLEALLAHDFAALRDGGSGHEEISWAQLIRVGIKL